MGSSEQIGPVTHDDENAWRTLVLESALDAVIGMGADDEILDWNLQAEKIFGWSKKEVLGKNLAEIIIPPQFREAHNRGMAHYRATGIGPILNMRVEVEAMRRDGTFFPIELTVVPIWLRGKQVFYSFLRDLTETRQVALERNRLQERIKFISEATKTLLQEPLSLEGRLDVLVKLIVPKISDWCSIELLRDGKLEQVAAHHADSVRLPPANTLISKVLRTGEPEWVETITDEQLRKLGMSCYLCLPLKARGHILGALSLVTTVSGRRFEVEDRIMLEELALRASFAIDNALLYLERTTQAEKLREAVLARDEFLSIASHELKTPLTSMKLQTQLHHKRLRSGESLATDPKLIDKLLSSNTMQIDRLARLVEDMLDISRIAHGKLQITREPTDLGQVTREVLDRFAEELSEKSIRYRISTESHLIGNWDRYRIEQVITNLLTNAIKYGEGRTIEISVTGDELNALLCVRDHGMGIDPEKLSIIFQRFERAVGANNISGLGLGLYITRQIIDAHGGTIRVESELGKGSTFIVELPL